MFQYKSDSTYTFYFKFYRDCGGAPEPTSVGMCILNTCTNQSYSRVMTKMTTLPGGGANGQQVSTGCANKKNTCDSFQSDVPGYKEWWYTVDFTLPSRCANWRFSALVQVRNPSGNIVGLPNFYVETILNNVDVQGNSSPVFSVKPVPYVCLNQAYSYNNGGVDPNGDSVAFEVTTPLTHNGNCASAASLCTYQSATPSYSIPTNPFQTNNTFAISPTTGEMTFTPSLQGSHTVSVRAKEYRNGTFIGSVMRDIQVQVIPCVTQSVKPVITPDPTSVGGSATISNGTVIGCATKQMSFCFDIKTTDPNAVLVATDNHNIALPGSNITYTNTKTDSMRACVVWTPSALDTGTRVFVVTVKDSSCSSGGVPISYAITVPVYVWAVTAAIKDTAICIGESVELTAVGGTGYFWSVVPGGSPITSLSCVSCKNPIASPTVTTSYIVTSNSAAVCNQSVDTLTVTVKPKPTATATSNSPVCPGSTLNLNGTAVTGATYSWIGPNTFSSTLQSPTIPNAQSVNSGFYGFSVTKDGCTSDMFILQAYVGPPAGPAASSNSPVCLGNQIILTATTVSGTTVTYHWTGPNGFSANTQNVVINPATYADSGRYYVYAMKDGCKTFIDSVNIKVNALPGAPSANADTLRYCQNVVAPALTGTGTNLKWYTTLTGGVGNANLSPSTLVAGVFKYYVSQTDGNGCEGPRDSTVVVITPKPSNPGVTSSISYCQFATATPLTATGTNLKWFTTPFGGTALSGAPTPSTTTPGNTVFYVSQTDGNTGCESDRTPISVTVFATPAAPGASDVNYCVGSPATPPLSSFVTGTNIKWYDEPTGGTGSSTTPSVNTTAPYSDTFYVSQTLNTCEGARARIIVNVVPKPNPPVTRDTAYCQFATASALTASGTGLRWYTTKTGGTGTATAPTPSTAAAGIFKYYVAQTSGGCESERDSITVTIHAKPAKPVGDDDSLCQDVIAGPLTATGSNLLWYTVPTGGIGNATAPVPATVTPGTYFWYVSQSANGCESDRDTVTIEIVQKPQAPVADSLEICLNGTADTLKANGQNLLWYTTPTGGSGNTAAPVPSTTSIGVTHYYVSQTINGCESDRDTLTVIVDTLLTVSIVSSDDIFCVYDSVEISQTGKMPDTSAFTWTWDGGTVLSGDTSGPYMIKWNTPGIKKITVLADNNGCKASDTSTVEVLPVPIAYFAMDGEICADRELTILVDSVLENASVFNWGFEGKQPVYIMPDSNKLTVRWDTIGRQVISLVTVSDSGCISAAYYDTINLRDFPAAKILPPAYNKVCTKSEITLTAESLQDGLYKYEWSPEEYFITNRSSQVAARTSSSGYMKVTVTDQYGCSGTDSVYMSIKLCCKAQLPDAFSPNGDGLNDKFGIISNGNYRIFSFRVVNRYGQEVFSTTNQNDRWDGMFNGTAQGIGTYYYYMKYTCEDDDADNVVEERGNVILLR